MTIEIIKNKDETVIEVSGRLDTITAPALDSSINECAEYTKNLILDLQNLEYISSAGLRRLLTILIVLSSLLKPSNARYSHCTGISTESAAVRILTVVKPSEGEQSMKI